MAIQGFAPVKVAKVKRIVLKWVKKGAGNEPCIGG
jgi:hypothetical protein